MRKFIDTDHPAFKPVWIRVVTTAVCLAWGAFELATGSPFWAIIFLGLGAYCVYAFFFDFHPEDHPFQRPPESTGTPKEPD